MKANFPKDLHAILGVSKKAGAEELRKAYLALAVKYHPDRNQGDTAAEERFKDISQAYAILSDPNARARYERLRSQKKPTRPGNSTEKTKTKTKTDDAPKAKPQSRTSTGYGPQSSYSSTQSSNHSSNPQGQSTKAKPERTGTGFGPEPDNGNEFGDILDNFFKSSKGRETLRDLEGEMNKAGVKFKAEDFAGWLKDRQKKDSPPKPPKKKPPLLARFFGWLLRTTEKPGQADINYHISLSPEAAILGTQVDISYQGHPGVTRHLKVKIPPNTHDGTKLRLNGQGNPKADGTRGDLILTATVGGQTVSDLWKT